MVIGRAGRSTCIHVKIVQLISKITCIHFSAKLYNITMRRTHIFHTVVYRSLTTPSRENGALGGLGILQHVMLCNVNCKLRYAPRPPACNSRPLPWQRFLCRPPLAGTSCYVPAISGAPSLSRFCSCNERKPYKQVF